MTKLFKISVSALRAELLEKGIIATNRYTDLRKLTVVQNTMKVPFKNIEIIRFYQESNPFNWN